MFLQPYRGVSLREGGSEGPTGAPRGSGPRAGEQHRGRAPAEPAAGSGPANPRWDPRSGPRPPVPSAHARPASPPTGLAWAALPAAPSLPPAILHGRGPSPFCFRARLSPRRGPFPQTAQNGPLRRAPRACRGNRSAGSGAAAQPPAEPGPLSLGHGSAHCGPPGPVRSRPPRATALTDTRAVRGPHNTSKLQRNVRRAWRGGAL